MSASIVDQLEELWRNFTDYLRPTYEPLLPNYRNPHVEMPNRQEILIKLATTCLGLAVSFTISYFGLKYLAKVLDPTMAGKKEAEKRAKELMNRIGVDSKLTEYELCIAANLVHPLDMVTSWEHIGGLEEVIQEIQETVIVPFTKTKIFSKSSLLQPPKGVLLYGPPGCGKTMIAKAMAKTSGARFINLEVSSLVDKWYGESQQRAQAIFSLARKIQPTIIFIDEIDSFLRSRASLDNEATSMMKAQFMVFWDGLVTDSKCQIMIVGATNRPQDVDAAILRRMPTMFHIRLPILQQRINILNILLVQEDGLENIDLKQLAQETEGFSGSDLHELCRKAMIYRVRDYLRSKQQNQQSTSSKVEEEDLRPLEMNDLLCALQKIRQSRLVSLVAAQHIDEYVDAFQS